MWKPYQCMLLFRTRPLVRKYCAKIKGSMPSDCSLGKSMPELMSRLIDFSL